MKSKWKVQILYARLEEDQKVTVRNRNFYMRATVATMN